MSEQIDVLPAPELSDLTPLTKFQREARAFQRLLPDLLASHRGEFAAIHEERPVDFGPDQATLASRQYERYGRVPIYVGLVTDEPASVVSIRSPRLVAGRNESRGDDSRST